MGRSGGLGREDTGTFHDDIDTQFLPGQIFWIAFTGDTDPVAIDNQLVAFDRHFGREFAMRRIVSGQQSDRINFAWIVDGDNLDIMTLAVFIMGAKNVSSDTAVTIDCHANSHKFTPECIKKPVKRYGPSYRSVPHIITCPIQLRLWKPHCPP